MTHVLIIGGGVIGTSIAYHLARYSCRVTLLDRGDLASGTSGACDGVVFMQSKKPGIHLELALASLARFRELDQELPHPMEFNPAGGMVIIETPAEYEAMKQFVRDQQSLGLDVSLIDAEEARARIPGLSDHILGATFSPMDAQVNPMALTHAFALGAVNYGASILTNTPVMGIEIRQGRVTGVRTKNGVVRADLVVNAAGVFAPDIAKMVGVHLPITPRRGQIVVTEPVLPLLPHCLLSARYIAAKYNPELAREGQGISMEQAKNGNLLLGSTREFVGYDRSTTPEAIGRIVRETCRIIPGLARLQAIRTFAGLRPYTPDGLPILGPVKGLDGFMVAAGHEGDGIALSPITGKLMAGLILDRETGMRLDAFSPDRFCKPGGVS
ncbi:MAG: FAD-binding oxidoreductase [Pseudomonadota bacterium]